MSINLSNSTLPKKSVAEVKTYNCQVRIKWIFIFRPHNFVQVIGSGVPRRNLVIFIKDRDVRKTIANQMKGGREAKGSPTNNDDRVGLGETHFQLAQVSMRVR